MKKFLIVLMLVRIDGATLKPSRSNESMEDVFKRWIDNQTNCIQDDILATDNRNTVLRCDIVQEQKGYGLQNIVMACFESDSYFELIQYTRAACDPVGPGQGPLCTTSGHYQHCRVVTEGESACYQQCCDQLHYGACVWS